MDINAMRQRRGELASQARAILDGAQATGRDITGEESASFDRLMDEHDTLGERITREERVRDAERVLDGQGDPPPAHTDPEGDGGEGERANRAWGTFLRDGRAALGAEDVRALNMGSDPEGGYLVAPQRFVQDLIQAVDDQVFIRGLATTMTLVQNESLGVPTLDTDLNDAEWTSELSTGSDDDSLRFGKRELRPNPLAKRVKVSRTLLRRSTMSPEQIVRDRLAFKFGVTQEKGFLTGSGSKQPLGLFTASDSGIPTSRDTDIGASGAIGATATVADQLIDAKYALKAQYHSRARWLFHRDLIKAIRKLKDSNNVYIWNAGLSSDRPNTILDIPYVVSEFAPNTVSANSYVGMIADFSYYWIVDSLSMEVQRLNELYAEANQVGFIARLETDGMPVLSEPFVRLKVKSGA